MTETDLQRQILLALSDERHRLFRNTVGEGWQGRDFIIRNGSLVGGNARHVIFGLAPGSSDLIGATSMVITPAMVGTPVAVFTAIECKLASRATPHQLAFIRMVHDLGGFAGVASSIHAARQIVTDFSNRPLT